MSTGQNKNHGWRLVGDVGGTNARFALVPPQGDLPEQEKTLACSDFSGLAAAIAFYLAEAGGVQPEAAAVAVATPIVGDQIRFTNNDWSFSIAATQKQLGLERLLMLNDFTALALSLPHLPAHEIQEVGNVPAPSETAAIGLLGPGTGLGVSGLIPDGRGAWIPIRGEGGHVTMSAANERELEVLRCMMQLTPHVSAERMISGFGLPAFYRAVAMVQGVSVEDLEPSEITERGRLGTCPVCREVVDMFCAMLGTVAGNLALTLGARGGVYIGGGIVPKLGEYFLNSAFRERFEAKGRFVEYMQAIPTRIILAKYPALLGAAKALEQA